MGCTATGVNLGTPATADNCSVASVTNNAPTFFPLNGTTVTWTVTDGSGNIATATQTVMVTDNVNPTIIAPPTVNTTTNTGCTATSVSLGIPVTADNCSVASVTNDAPTAFPLNSTTVTWTVTDGSGNTSTAAQTVMVTDNVNPTITAPAIVNATTNSGCTATGVSLGTPVTADNCSVASVTNDHVSTTYLLGNTTVTWIVTDGSGNTATATQIVMVTDNVNPTITAPPTVNATTNAGCTATSVSLGIPVTADNCSVASITNDAPTVFPLNSTTVTWTVIDGSGNTATATQIVMVTDNVNPTITAPPTVNATTNAGCTATSVSLGIPITADNCSVASVTNDAPTVFPLNSTTVTWTVIDGSGNTVTATQIVTVTDNVNPTITAPADITVCNGMPIILGNPIGSDNCGTVTFTSNAPTVFPVGTTNVLWTANDGHGNIATATQTIVVNPLLTWYLDADSDGHFVGGAVSSCTSPGVGYTTNVGIAGDCDDSNSAVYQTLTVYVDVDGDGYTVGTFVSVCSGASLPNGYSATSLGTDCDDINASLTTNCVAIYAYIANYGSNTVSVINTTTNSVVATIPVGDGPESVSVNSDGSRVYVGNGVSNSISVIDASNTVDATIPVGGYPYGVFVSNDKSKVYVTLAGLGLIRVIDVSLYYYYVSATINVGTETDGITGGLDGSIIYVTNPSSNSVSVINTSSNTVVATIPVGNSPKGLCVSVDGSKLFVSNYNSNTVSVIDIVSNTVSETIPVGDHPRGICTSPDGSKVYVGNQFSGDISIINVVSNSVEATIPLGNYPMGISMHPNGNKLYVANFSGSVSVLNTTTNMVTNNVSVGNEPRSFGNFIKSGITCTKADIPTLSASNTTNCGTQSTILSVVNGSLHNATDWNWYSGSCGGTLVGTGSSITVSPTVTTLYYARGEGGCVSTGWCGDISITVNPIPNVGSTASVYSLCSGDNITLTGTGATTYNWSGGAPNGTAFTPPIGTTTFTVTGTSLGCSNTSTQTITVNPIPTVGSTSSANTVCAGTSVALNGTGATTYSWTGGVINGTAFPPAVGTITYTVTGTSLGCSATSTQVVSVNPLPIGSTTNPTICSGANSNLTLNSTVSGTTYSWTSSVISGNVIGNSNCTSGCGSTISDVLTNLGNVHGVIQYVITPTSPSGCVGNSFTANVTVGVAPAQPVIAGLSVLCGYGSTVYKCPAVADATNYTWTVPTGATGMTITSGQGTTSLHVNISGGTVTGNVTCVASNSCGNSSIASMAVSKKPVTPVSITGPTSLCGQYGSTTYSILPSAGATSYSWVVPSGMTITLGAGTTQINSGN